MVVDGGLPQAPALWVRSVIAPPWALCAWAFEIKLIKTTKNVTNFLDEEVFDIIVFIVEFCCFVIGLKPKCNLKEAQFQGVATRLISIN